MAMHENQVNIDQDQVSLLIADELPHLNGLEIQEIDSGGTVNAIYKVGPDVVLRFPLQRTDSDQAYRRLLTEFNAAEEFRRASPVPSPEPLHIGQPGHGYPMPWFAQTWLEGEDVTPTSVASSSAFAQDLAALIKSLRSWDLRGRRFDGTGRGGELTDSDEWVEECMRKSEAFIDTVVLRRMWRAYRALPHEDTDVMSHCDLIPGNVLTSSGHLAGVLDTGGFKPADPALDLVGAWHLLDNEPREALRNQLGCSDLQWERGKAWAFQQAAGAFWYYRTTNPRMAKMGHTTLLRLMEDF